MSVFDIGMTNGLIIGVLLVFAVIFGLIAFEIDKKLRKYRYRYGYDQEIEHPTRDKDYHPNERFADWVKRVDFKKKEII